MVPEVHAYVVVESAFRVSPVQLNLDAGVAYFALRSRIGLFQTGRGWERFGYQQLFGLVVIVVQRLGQLVVEEAEV